MNTIDNNSTKTINAAPYQSVARLKEAHISLIKRHRGESGADDANTFYDDVEEFLRCASATGALLDDYEDREASQSLLDYWATVLMRVKRVPPEATLDDFDETLSPILDDQLCPYLGLNAFQEKDKDFFYGRQRMIDHLIGEMKDRRFLFVVGPSGSGKSSLVLGGAIPALQNGVLTGSERWQYFPRVLPGANPLKSLAAALGFRNPDECAATAEKFKRDRERLLLLVEERSSEPAVLVVDQFEELFTLCADETVRDAFVENLIALVNSPSRKHAVIVTLRNDYEPNLVRIQSLLPYYETGQIRVTPLTATDLRAAIEEPAKRVGLKFESGIVDALVKDILGEPAGLPLLQFTLLQLWKRRENKRSRITWRNYRGLGDARRALSLTAEEFYNSLTDEKKVTVKRILLRMARPSESFEVTSNRVKRSTLYKSEGVPQRVDEVIDRLLGAGLVRLTTGDRKENDQIEVAHEALVRNWRRLVEWLEDDRVNLRQRIRLTSAADQWVEHNRDAGGLLGGKVLEEALAFDDLNELELEFVKASQVAAEAAEQEKAAAAFREQALEKARAIAFEQRAIEVARSAGYFRRFALVSSFLAVIALAAAGWALYNASRARASEREQKTLAVKAQEESDRAEKESQAAMENLAKANAESNRAEKESQTAIEQYNRAEKESQAATEQYNRAEAKRREAEDARTELTKALEQVKKEREQADNLRREAEQSAGEIKAALDKAQEQTKRADEADEKLRQANEQKLKLMEMQREADRRLERNRGSDAIKLYENLLQEYAVAESPTNVRETQSKLVKAYRAGSLRAKKEADAQQAELYSNASRDAYQAAEKMFSNDINDIRKKIEESGQLDPAIVPALEERAEFYLYQGDAKNAGKDFFAAFEMQEKILSKENYYESFAEFDYLVERLKELPDYKYNVALLTPIFERDLAAKEKFFDAKSLNVYLALNQLGDLYKNYYLADGERQNAAKIYAKALAIARTQEENPFGVTTNELIVSLKNLGDVYFSRLQYKDARPYYEELVKIVADGSRSESFESAAAKIKLAEVYKRSNDEKNEGFYKKLENLYLLANRFLAKEPDKYRTDLIEGLDGLGEIYFDQGKTEAAKKTYDEMIKIIGSDFISLGVVNSRFRSRADESIREKRFDKAELYYQLLLDLAENSGENSINVYYAAFDLADFYRSQRIVKTAQTEALYKRVLAAAKAVFKDDETGEVNIRTRNALAEIYDGQNKVAEADTFYKNNLAVLEKSPAQQTDTRLLVETLKVYAEFLQRRFPHRQAEAEALLARARDLTAKGK